MESQEKNFNRGFNNGYLIAKYQPDLFEKIEKIDNPTNEYFQSLLLGKKEYEKENLIYLKELADKKTQSKDNNEREREK